MELKNINTVIYNKISPGSLSDNTLEIIFDTMIGIKYSSNVMFSAKRGIFFPVIIKISDLTVKVVQFQVKNNFLYGLKIN